jgi:carbon storage regulator
MVPAVGVGEREAPAVTGETDTGEPAAAGVRNARERILVMGQLVLSRKVGEVICIGDNIRITTVRIGRDRVRYGIECPKEINIVREELQQPSSGEPNDELPIERDRLRDGLAVAE